MALPDTPPLGLYVHLPWCERKCPYCDFNSHARPDRIPEDDYVAAIEADLTRDAASVAGRSIESVFIGGGTPSLFSAGAIGRILSAADRLIGLSADTEITLEANPGSAEAARFAGFRSAGVNRLSIGVQSFNDRLLTAIGRIHDGSSARRAVDAAHDAGFERLNLDLMYGLPDQSRSQALTDVETALSSGADHISHYELTLEPNTVFYSRPPSLPDDDLRFDMQDDTEQALTAAGFHRYEISAWSRPGGECRHNLNYWRFGDYLAVGAGAHGKLTGPTGEIERFRRHRIPERYMQLAEAGASEVERHGLSAANRRFEFMLNALRLVDGFSADQFCRRTGLAWDSVAPTIEQLCQERLLEAAGKKAFRPTRRGLDFLNDCQARFLPEPDNG